MVYLPQHLSPMAQRMLRSLETLNIENPAAEDWQGIRQQVRHSAEQARRLWQADGAHFRTETTQCSGVSCLWTHPPTLRRDDQILLYLHGGGYVSGCAQTLIGLPHAMAAACGLRVLSIDYRLAPEHPFPAALDDITAVYRYLLEAGFGGSDLGVFGESAGGGLALAAIHRLHQEELASPAALVVLSPWADLSLDGDTGHSLRHADPFLELTSLRAWAKAYAGGRSLREPLISPLMGEFTDFPPLLIQAGSKEILLSDALRLARRARQHGAAPCLDVWDGMWHAFQATPGLPEAREALAEAGRFFCRHLL